MLRTLGRCWTPIFILLASLAAPAGADKNDVVLFSNGDRLTGEIKKLERGKLRFKTDATDTISIEWDDVARLSSDDDFDVWLESGERLFGSLAAPSDGRLEIVGDQTRVLELPMVVAINPIEEKRRERLDGFLDLGFSFTQADDRAQLSIGAEVSSRGRNFLRKVSLSSVLSAQEGVDETRRADVKLDLTRFLRHPKRLLITFASLQHNEELGLDLRSLAGIAYGWTTIRTNTERLTFLGGASVTREALDEDPSKESLETVLGVQFESFKFDQPERDIAVSVLVFPSLSESGRVRAELEAKIRWEIVEDFFFGLTVLESYDSAPPAGAEGNDLTAITSLGWSF